MRVLTIILAALVAVSTAANSQETSWPQELTGDDGTVVLIYQPQVEVFTGNSLQARAAVSVKSGSTNNAPVFGAIWISAKIDTDRDTRTAVIRDIDISDVRFADAKPGRGKCRSRADDRTRARAYLALSINARTQHAVPSPTASEYAGRRSVLGATK